MPKDIDGIVDKIDQLVDDQLELGEVDTEPECADLELVNNPTMIHELGAFLDLNPNRSIEVHDHGYHIVEPEKARPGTVEIISLPEEPAGQQYRLRPVPYSPTDLDFDLAMREVNSTISPLIEGIIRSDTGMLNRARDILARRVNAQEKICYVLLTENMNDNPSLGNIQEFITQQPGQAFTPENVRFKAGVMSQLDRDLYNFLVAHDNLDGISDECAANAFDVSYKTMNKWLSMMKTKFGVVDRVHPRSRHWRVCCKHCECHELVKHSDFIKFCQHQRSADIDYGDVDSDDIEANPSRVIAEKPLAQANAVSSLITGSGDHKHRPVLDIDMPCLLLESTTPAGLRRC